MRPHVKTVASNLFLIKKNYVFNIIEYCQKSLDTGGRHLTDLSGAVST